ncbi:hypothetical protein ACFVHB_37790 [Kitasatospora sp. NPDC127111]|uniref:hypothetical protein n=1 Tax=Kitasatospora sp. NPDC127111 TaxID=3345363 RepID=UPI0036264066
MTDFDADGTVRLLRELAEESSGLITLDPGIDDGRMDGWPVPVPEDVRVLLRAVGGVRVMVSRSVQNGHTSYEHLDFAHPYNEGRYAGCDTSWYLDHAGGTGSHWFLYTDHGDGHTYVDVDRATGAWGPVFQFWDATDTVRAAPSLPAWLDRFADCARRALAGTATTHPHTAADTVTAATETATGPAGPDAATVNAFGRRFGDHWWDLDRNATAVAPVTAAEARAAADPVLREAAAGLPDDALLADLRAVTGPARVDFPLPYPCRYARHSGGAVLSATPWDGD